MGRELKWFRATIQGAFHEYLWKEDKVQVDELLRQIGSIQMPCITTEQKQSRNQEFSFADVEAATMQLGPLKAPGPNGTPPLFFQRYWDVTSTTIASARCQTSY